MYFVVYGVGRDSTCKITLWNPWCRVVQYGSCEDIASRWGKFFSFIWVMMRTTLVSWEERVAQFVEALSIVTLLYDEVSSTILPKLNNLILLLNPERLLKLSQNHEKKFLTLNNPVCNLEQSLKKCIIHNNPFKKFMETMRRLCNFSE